MLKALSLNRGHAAALTFFLITLLVVACGGEGQGDGAGRDDANTVPGYASQTQEVPTHWASGNAKDLRALLRTSDEVFFGRVTGVLGQSEIELPASIAKARAGLPITSFEITVESVMAGGLAPGASVLVEQVGGTIETSGGGSMNIILEHDKLLLPGAEYLFFAAYKNNGKLSVPPFGRLQVTADGSLEPLPVWSEMGALRQLTGLTASQATSRVGAAQ
jgi:hypothetical protein